ncbi:MAG: hypothetical protein R3F19_16640 [Verrucomicrobiales bacterium]
MENQYQVIQICSADPAIETVAMSALATGYGHLELDAFVRTAAALSMPGDLTVTLAIDHDLSFAQIVRLAAEENLHATEAPIFQ